MQRTNLNPEQKDYEEKANRILKQLSQKLAKSISEFSLLLHSCPLKATGRNMPISTDGKYILYNPAYILEHYKTEGAQRLVYELMHVCLHLLFGHPEESRKYKHHDVLWNLQDQMVHTIAHGIMAGASTDWMNSQLTSLVSDYYHMVNQKKDGLSVDTKQKKNALAELKQEDFSSDNHTLWLKQADGSQNTISIVIDGSGCTSEQIQEIKQFVQKLANCFNQNLREEFGNSVGQTEMKCEALADSYDWRDMVQKVLQPKVLWREQEQIFDRALYTYGLELYEDIPLIEPCEIEEEKASLGGIVIAIDTSGSCSGDIAGQFLAGIELVLLEIQPFMEPEQDIVLLQCDTQIQSEEYYRPKDVKKGMFEEKILRGFGGTSFEPVFRYVNEKNEREYSGKNRVFDTLIYFTDGMGDFGEFSEMEVDAKVIFVIPKEADLEIESLALPEYIEVIQMEGSK